MTEALRPPSLRPAQGRLSVPGQDWRRLVATLRPLGLPLGIIGLAIALYAQAQIHATRDTTNTGWLLVLGAIYFGVGLADVALEQAHHVTSAERPWLWALGLAGGAVGLLSYRYFNDNTFTPTGTVLWLGGLTAFLVSFGAADALGGWLKGRARALAERGGIVIPWAGLALLAILLLATALRFDRLDIIPGDMGEDMPHNYENAKSILAGQFSIFFPSHPGREGMMMYLQALYGRIFGLSYYGLKATSAIIGVVAVAVMFLVARSLFDNEVALYAALLMAVSRWHVTASRMGLRLILMSLFVLIITGLLVRALRSGRRLDYALLGLGLGLGMYTYNAWLIMPPAVVGIILAHQLFVRREARPSPPAPPPGLGEGSWLYTLRATLPNLVIAVFTAALVFVPLARYASDFPERYTFRVATRITGAETALPENIPAVFLENLRRTAIMFNVTGDAVARYNVAFEPQLGPVSAALFLLGVAYALARWRRGPYLALLLLLAATALPTALSIAFPNEVPASNRAAGSVAPAILLAALPLPALRRRLVAAVQGTGSEGGLRLTSALVAVNGRRWQISLNPAALLSPLLAVSVALLFVTETNNTIYAYFVTYPDQMYMHNYDISGEIAREFDRLWPNGPVYAVIYPHFYDGNATRAQLRVAPPEQVQQNELNPENFAPDKPPLSTIKGKAAFIVHPQDQRALQILQSVFPKGVLVAHPYKDGVAFYTFIGER